MLGAGSYVCPYQSGRTHKVLADRKEEPKPGSETGTCQDSFSSQYLLAFPLLRHLCWVLRCKDKQGLKPTLQRVISPLRSLPVIHTVQGRKQSKSVPSRAFVPPQILPSPVKRSVVILGEGVSGKGDKREV